MEPTGGNQDAPPFDIDALFDALIGSMMRTPAYLGPPKALLEKQRDADRGGGTPWTTDTLHPDTHKAVLDIYGEISRPSQNQGLKYIKAGRNLLFTSNSGGGVSTACQIAGVDYLVCDTTIADDNDWSPRVVTVGDTREVARQYKQEQTELGWYVNSGKDKKDKRNVDVGLFYGHPEKYSPGADRSRPRSCVGIAACPGDLVRRVKNNETDWTKVKLVIIENAHKLARMSFREQLENGILAIIKISIEAGNEVQVILNTHERKPSKDMEWMSKTFLGGEENFTRFEFHGRAEHGNADESQVRDGGADTLMVRHKQGDRGGARGNHGQRGRARARGGRNGGQQGAALARGVARGNHDQ